MITFTTPICFWEDHISRSDDPHALRAAEIARVSDGMKVCLTVEQFQELESDADFYADMGVREFGPEYLGVVTSARATLRRIAKVDTGK